MSRPLRELKKKFIVFCEGDAEYYYIDKIRKNQGVEISIETINMKGGGYTNFLKEVKTKAQTNCIAKFVIIDADRLIKDVGEEKSFKALLEYCTLQNKKGAVPHFLIVNNPDFEYVSCLHIKEYRGEDTSRFITSTLGFKNVEEFKSKKDVYDYLNREGRTYQNMVNSLKDKPKLIRNKYMITKKRFDVQIKETVLNWNQISGKCSNIEEFFDVIDW